MQMLAVSFINDSTGSNMLQWSCSVIDVNFLHISTLHSQSTASVTRPQSRRRYAHAILTRNWYQKLVPESGTSFWYQLQDFWYQKSGTRNKLL